MWTVTKIESTTSGEYVTETKDTGEVRTTNMRTGAWWITFKGWTVAQGKN